MSKDIFITRHPSLDFVLAHIFSIILFSKNGITLKHENSSLIALYPKGLPVQKPDCSWKTYRKQQKPCLITTAYSIKLLAKTADFILKFPQTFKNSSLASNIGSELANLSILQLDYCLENLESNPYSIELYTSLIEGCLAVSKLKEHQPSLDMSCSQNYNTAIDILYNRLAVDPNLNLANSLQLSKITNTIYELTSQSFPIYDTDIISKTALELAHRRNSLGLFQKDQLHRKIAPLSWQFHCISSLLLSHSISPIDKLLEGAFSVFNHLYQLSWNSSLGLFTFSRSPYVRYTPFQIASTIKALFILSQWVSEEEQLKQLQQILSDSYFSITSDNFWESYHQSTHVLYRRFMDKMNVNYEPYTQGYNIQVYKAPVFPAGVQITRSAITAESQNDLDTRQIRWINHFPIHLRYPLELCIYILDYLHSQYQKQDRADKEALTIDWIDLLLSIIPEQD